MGVCVETMTSWIPPWLGVLARCVGQEGKEHGN